MDDKFLQVLVVAIETCSAATKALNDPATSTNSDFKVDVVLGDLKKLLTLLYQSVTKISLAMKPPKPAFSATIPVLRDLISYVDSLASCACSIDIAQGATLTKEVRWSVEEVIGAVNTFLLTYTSGEQFSDVYLRRAGTVHEAIDRARAISMSNLDAVKKRWEGNTTGIQDVVREVAEMIEEEQAPEGLADDEDHGDWDELGLDVPQERRARATQDELARLSSAHKLFKFTHALHKRVSSSVFGSLSTQSSVRTLDRFITQSTALLGVSDEVVSSLYIPHDLDALAARLQSYDEAIWAIRECLEELGILDTLDAAADRLSLEDQKDTSPASDSDQQAKNRKWFELCFDQIQKSRQDLLSVEGGSAAKDIKMPK